MEGLQFIDFENLCKRECAIGTFPNDVPACPNTAAVRLNQAWFGFSNMKNVIKVV